MTILKGGCPMSDKEKDLKYDLKYIDLCKKGEIIIWKK